MTKTYEIRETVQIDASPEKVWEALTRPEIIKKWFFGVDTKTDWKVGSPIVHTGVWKDKPYEDKGTILEAKPGKSLAHSHWSSMSGLPDEPENYQRVDYSLKEGNEGTELTVTESRIPDEKARDVSGQSWKRVLANLKDAVE